mgnify:CR=1 FL=1
MGDTDYPWAANPGYGPPPWVAGAMRLAAGALAGLAAVLLVSSAAFAVPPGETTRLSPVPFDRTVRLGMTTAGTAEAGAADYAVPRAEVFYSQYRYVVGYQGIATLVDELDRDGTAQQFGRPLAIFVSDFADSGVVLTEAGYLRTDPGGAAGWIPAREAAYVVESRARTPGGPAVVPFADRGDARRFADRAGGTVIGWEALRERSFATGAASRTGLQAAVRDRHRWADDTVGRAHGLLDRPVSVTVGTDAPTLDAAVAAAPPNTTVRIPPGTYRGSLTIEKPITLRGAGTTTRLAGDGTGSVVRVDADRVAVTGLRITGVGSNASVESVPGRHETDWDYRVAMGYGYGDAGVEFNRTTGSLVADVAIETPANGVLFRDSDEAVVLDTTVNGTAEWADGFMGVMVFDSRIVVQNSTFVGGRDGVYTHLAHGSVIRDNTMRGMRFGVHEMFTSDALVTGNRVRDTNVGLIVMTTPSGNLIVDNDVRESNEGLSIAGSGSYIAGNVLADNHIGMAVSGQRSLYERNVVVANRIGVRAETVLPTNRVTANDLAANDRPALSVLGPLRVWADDGRGNYWRAAPGTDRDGDGTLERAFQPTDPVDRRVERVPGARTLATSPATMVLSRVAAAVTGLRGTGVVDPAPLTRPVRPAVLANVTATEGAS